MEQWLRELSRELIDRHMNGRLRKWRSLKRKMKTGEYVRFSDDRLDREFSLERLAPRTKRLPWAKA